MNDRVGSDLMELTKKGWTTRDIAWQGLAGATEGRVKEGRRRVDDASSLAVPLNTYSV